MTIQLTDKRPVPMRVPGMDISNGTWFGLVNETAINKIIAEQAKTQTPYEVTPAIAKRCAEILAAWNPPPWWSSDREIDRKNMKLRFLEFFLTCNGFRIS